MNKIKVENTDFLKQNAFELPDDYFEKSFDKIVESVLNKSFSLDSEKKEFILPVPEAYFEELTISILDKALKWKKIDEIEVTQNYIVPERYFDLLPMQIQAKVNKKRLIFEFDLPVFVPKLAYASIAAVLVLGIFFGLNYKIDNTCADMLCSVSKSEIREYLNQTVDAHEEAIHENKTIENILPQTTDNQQEIIEQIDVSQLEYEL